VINRIDEVGCKQIHVIHSTLNFKFPDEAYLAEN